MNFSPYGLNSQGEALPKFPVRACKMILHDTIRHGTILSVGATNPNSTTSTSGYPQPTISGFFVPAIWATTPGCRTDELHIHADHGGSVSAFAVWLRGPNKPARVNKARLLVEVVDAMPHPHLQHGRLTKPRESTGHDLHLLDPAFPYLPLGRPTPYSHHFRLCQQRNTSPVCAGRSTPSVFVPHPEQGGCSMKRTIRTRQVIQAEALFEQSALLASALSCICESNTERMLYLELSDLLHPLQTQLDELETGCAGTPLAEPAERINRYASVLLKVLNGNQSHIEPCVISVLLTPVLAEFEAVELAKLREGV